MPDTSHLHSMLVHVPIALVVFGFLADVASLFFKREARLSRWGFYLLLLGTFSALVTWLTGIFASEMSEPASRIKETHVLFAWITLGILMATSVFRILLHYWNRENTYLKWLAFALYALAMLFVSITGYYGIILVYSYMTPL
jgi:uncharacterized membrane protein